MVMLISNSELAVVFVLRTLSTINIQGGTNLKSTWYLSGAVPMQCCLQQRGVMTSKNRIKFKKMPMIIQVWKGRKDEGEDLLWLLLTGLVGLAGPKSGLAVVFFFLSYWWAVYKSSMGLSCVSSNMSIRTLSEKPKCMAV